MAEDVTPADARAGAPLQLVPTRRDRARKSSYRLRFGILYVALAAIVGAGVGAFVVLATRPAPPEAAAWSSWEPTGSKLARVRQIADRIPKAYKQANGEQLTVSQASPLAVPTEAGDMPVTSIFVRPDTSRGLAEESDIDAYQRRRTSSPTGSAVSAPARSARSSGQPSGERFMLLQPPGARALALHVQVRRRRRLGDRLHAAVAEGESNGSVFLRRDDVADELRRSDLSPSALDARRASGPSARSSWATS